MTTHPIVNFMALFKALNDKAEDRTVAICSGSYLDDVLGQAIATRLPGANSKLLEKLLSESGPIGPAAARIDLACALGLIGEEDRRAIIMIARVRNRFAHNILIDSFNHAQVAALIDNLPLTGFNRQDYEEAFSGSVVQTRRERFSCLAMMFGVRLSNYLNGVHQTGLIQRVEAGPQDQTDNHIGVREGQ